MQCGRSEWMYHLCSILRHSGLGVFKGGEGHLASDSQHRGDEQVRVRLLFHGGEQKHAHFVFAVRVPDAVGRTRARWAITRDSERCKSSWARRAAMCSWRLVRFPSPGNGVDNDAYRIGQIVFHREENDSKKWGVVMTCSVPRVPLGEYSMLYGV